MGNALNKVVNLEAYKEYIYINENDIISDTQKRLKNDGDTLLLEIVKISTKCDHERMPSAEKICKTIRSNKKDEWLSFSSNEDEADMREYIYEEKFIKLIQLNKDFIEAYIVEEEKINIWIVIQESKFENNKKYFDEKRRFEMANENIKFDIMIFDEDEREDFEEELNYREVYKKVCKNG